MGYTVYVLYSDLLKGKGLFKRLEHLNLPKFDYKKVFEDGNDVSLLYELKVGTPQVTSLVCLWAHVGDDGKIRSFRLIFDPRPYIQQR